jgi:hypothetical protein
MKSTVEKKYFICFKITVILCTIYIYKIHFFFFITAPAPHSHVIFNIVRYYFGGSMELNARILLLAYMVYL